MRASIVFANAADEVGFFKVALICHQQVSAGSMEMAKRIHRYRL
jgi:hypothetical protein